MRRELAPCPDRTRESVRPRSSIPEESKLTRQMGRIGDAAVAGPPLQINSLLTFVTKCDAEAAARGDLKGRLDAARRYGTAQKYKECGNDGTHRRLMRTARGMGIAPVGKLIEMRERPAEGERLTSAGTIRVLPVASHKRRVLADARSPRAHRRAPIGRAAKCRVPACRGV